MQEKDLLSKIESLKEIKPDSHWAVLTREKIFDKKEEPFVFPFLQMFGRPAVAAFASLGFAAVLFVSAQSAVPGDALYLVKRVSEKGQMALTSEEGKQDFNLLLAHRRLDEVSEIIRRNEINRLSSALKDLEMMKAKMHRDFAQAIESRPREEAIEIAKNFAPSILEIEEKEDLLMIDSLGVRIDEVSSNAAKDLVSLLIEDFENRSLTEEDEILLEEAKTMFKEKNYRTALKSVLNIGREKTDDEEDEEENDEDVNLTKEPQ